MALTLVALVSLLAVTIVLAVATLVVVRQRDSALATAEELRRALYASEMNDAFQSFDQANVQRAEMLLKNQIPNEGQSDLRGIEWYFGASLCQATQGIRLAADVRHATLSPDQMKLAALIDGQLVEIDLASRQRTVVFGRERKLLGWPVYSPDGKCLAIAAEDDILVMRMVRSSLSLPPPRFSYQAYPAPRELFVSECSRPVRIFMPRESFSEVLACCVAIAITVDVSNGYGQPVV